MKNELHAADYVGQPVGISQGQEFQPWDRIGFASIEPLPFLYEHKWDDIALAWVHGLRPSRIRVTNGWEQTDSRPWRVTVTVDDAGIIKEIRQEIQVGLPEGVNGGGRALRLATRGAQ